MPRNAAARDGRAPINLEAIMPGGEFDPLPAYIYLVGLIAVSYVVVRMEWWVPGRPMKLPVIAAVGVVAVIMTFATIYFAQVESRRLLIGLKRALPLRWRPNQSPDEVRLQALMAIDGTQLLADFKVAVALHANVPWRIRMQRRRIFGHQFPVPGPELCRQAGTGSNCYP